MRRFLSLAITAVLVLVAVSCKLTDPQGLKGKVYTGTYSGTKSGPMTCTMEDELNCRGTWTVNGAACTFAAGVNGSGTAAGSINCPTGSGTVSGNLTTGSFNGTWYGSFPASGSSGATTNYNGTFASSSGSSSSGGGGGSLVGTWDLSNGNLLVARQTFSGSATSGTGAVRSWSVTTPQLDGVYVEYGYTATSTSYTTTTTLYLMCDFVKGQWVASTQLPSGTTNFTLSSDGNSMTFANGDKYIRSSSSITKPSAGGTCTKQ
jgi:hypothetical protein